MDAFTPPEQVPPGQIDAGAALMGGLSAFARNLLPLAGAGFLGSAAYVTACCCVLPAIPVIPVLMWGMYAFVLEAVDGTARIGTVFRAFSDRFGDAWWRSALLLLILALLQLPALGAGAASGLVGDLGIHPMVPTLAASVFGIAWALLLARLSFAFFLLVERDLTPIDALATSWTDTEGQWAPIAGILLVGQLLGLPTVVASAWASASLQNVDPADMLEAIGPLYGSLLCAGLFGTVLQTWILLSLGVAFRQCYPRS